MRATFFVQQGEVMLLNGVGSEASVEEEVEEFEEDGCGNGAAIFEMLICNKGGTWCLVVWHCSS